MADRIYNVLFICTGNSARSIMAEAVLNRRGSGRFHAFSAGSHPKPEVHPLAIELLAKNGISTAGLRSKNWDEFARPGAPAMDFIFTVCDKAAGEVCPVWPGTPMTAHWGVADPAAVTGTPEEQRRAFWRAFRELDTRINLFTSLRLDDLDAMSIKRRLDEIGKAHTDLPK
jgi:arsenate reductase (thioredoxin)